MTRNEESWELPDNGGAPARTGHEASGTPTDPLIGRVLGGRYRVESMLGEGAMGAVYQARHIKVGRIFAVKVLHERLLQDPKTQKRFEREASLAGKLQHANVVGVIDVGETDDGIHFMVMEFAEGNTLGSLMHGPMDARRVILIAQQLCDGLQHAHEHGLIHRDFKPENVIVEFDRQGVERPRIVDFGIAILREDAAEPAGDERLTTVGLVLGTPHYMAPEHAMGGAVDHRIDLFALGVILFEMLTGIMPFEGDGVDVARANMTSATPVMNVRVPGLAVDPLLEAFTRLLMHKKPSERPDSAKAARHLLDIIESDRTMAARILGITPAAIPAAPGSSRRVPHSAMSLADISGPHASAPLTLHGPALGAPSPPSTPTRTLSTGQPPLTSEPVAILPGTGAHGTERVTAMPANRWPIVAGVGAAIAIAIVVVLVLTRASPSPATPATSAASREPAPTRTETPAPTPATLSATPVPAPAGNRVKPVQTAKPPIAKTVTKPAPVTTIKPPAVTTTAAIKTPRPATPDSTATDASTVAALYASVGRELGELDRAKGSNVVSQLWMRYRQIRIQDAMTSEDKRVAAIKTLSQLRRDAAATR